MLFFTRRVVRIVSIVGFLLLASVGLTRAELSPVLHDSLKSSEVLYDSKSEHNPNKPECPSIDDAQISRTDQGFELEIFTDVESELAKAQLIFTDGIVRDTTEVEDFKSPINIDAYLWANSVEISLWCSFKGMYFQGESVSYPVELLQFTPVDFCYQAISCGGQGHGWDVTTDYSPTFRYYEGDTVLVNTLPLRIEEITSYTPGTGIEGSFGTYDGSGIVALPFGEQVLIVDFFGVKIDNFTGNMVAGSVTPIRDNPLGIPLISQPPPAFCIAPPIGWDGDGKYQPGGGTIDPNGFDINGQYSAPPYDTDPRLEPYDPNYDPNGFDVFGNHESSGTPYNQYGCTREGLNSDGDPCSPPPGSPVQVPYGWVDPGAGSGGSAGTTGGGSPVGEPTPEGTEFVNNNYEQIILCITEGVDNWELAIQDIIDGNRIECDEARDNLSLAIDQLPGGAANPIATLVKGDAGEFFNEGMSDNFSEAPSLANLPTGRDAVIKEIEQRHVDLYSCDEGLQDYVEFILLTDEVELSIVQGVPTDGPPTRYEEAIIAQILSLEAYELKDFEDDAEALCEHILGLVNAQMEKLRLGQPLSSIYNLNESFNPYESSINYLNLTASTSMISGFSGNSSMEESVLYEWHQGWSTVGGQHRGLVLASHFQALPPTSGNGCDAIGLPLRITKQVGPVGYDVFIDNIVFEPQAPGPNNVAKGDFYYVLNDFGNISSPIVFTSIEANFDEAGFENGEIPLSIDMPSIPKLAIENVAALSFDPATTSVNIGCTGFSSISVGAQIEFCRNVIVPLDANGEVEPEPAMVSLDFAATFDSWEDVVISATPSSDFAPTAKQDVRIHAEEMILDRSSITTDHLVRFPIDYQMPSGAGTREQWKGFYCREFSASIPVEMGEAESVELVLEDFLIDKTGVSVLISAVAPGPDGAFVSLEEGSVGGWAASVDSVGLTIRQNMLKGFGFGGNLHLPIARQNEANVGNNPEPSDCLRYNGSYNRGVFTGQAKVAGQLHTDLLGGTLVFSHGTSIDMKLGGTDPGVVASLFGTFAASGSENPTHGGKERTLAPGSATFENFVIQTPNLGRLVKEPGNWTITGGVNASIAGYGLTVNNLTVDANQGNPDEIYLGFCAGVTLTNNFTANGRFQVVGKAESGSNFLDIVYDRVSVSSLTARAEIKKFKVAASFGFIDKGDPGYETWGKAFHGTGLASIGGVTGSDEPSRGGTSNSDDPCSGCSSSSAADFLGSGGKTLAASVQFGSIPSLEEGRAPHKYYYVDVFASGLAIPLGPPPAAVILDGLGGGLSYGVTTVSDDVDVFKDNGNNTDCELGLYGTSISGATYTPVVGSELLGVQLMATINAANKDAFSSYNRLRFEFGTNASIQTIQLAGEMKMMDVPISAKMPIEVESIPAEVGDTPAPSIAGAAPIKAIWVGDWSVRSNRFHMEIAAFLDAGNIRGAGTNNSLVRGVAHFEPGNWYVKLGGAKEGHRAGAILDLGPTVSASIEAYFQVGNGVDPIPQLPADVRAFFGNSNLVSIPNRNNGLGIAFGAHAAFNADFEAGIFFARASMLAGFDFNLQQYRGVSCAGTGVIGANGWYAQGQLYAYFAADAGVRRKNGNYTKLVELSLGASLQASLPNPTYLKGNVKARVKLGPLGGKAEFSLELGEQCDMVVDPELANMEDPDFDYIVYAQLPTGSPLELDQSFKFDLRYAEVVPLEFSNTTASGTEDFDYTVKLEVEKLETRRLDSDNNWVYSDVHGGATRISHPDDYTLLVEPSAWWPRNDTVFVRLKFVTYKGPRGQPGTTPVDTGTYVYAYPTGEYPSYISSANVAYCYPLPAQQEHLSAEITKHYIGLKHDQAYLFSEPYIYAVYTDMDNKVKFSTSNVAYSDSLKEVQVHYGSLEDFHEPDTKYFLYLARYIPPNPSEVEKIGPPVSHLATGLTDVLGQNTRPLVPFGFGVGDTFDPTAEYVSPIYSVGYKTSLYKTWEEKVSALNVGGNAVFNGDEHGVRIETNNVDFDRYETAIEGLLANTNSLVSIALELGTDPESNGDAEGVWYRAMTDFQAARSCLEVGDIDCPAQDELLTFDATLSGQTDDISENAAFDLIATQQVPYVSSPSSSIGVSQPVNLATLEGPGLGEGGPPTGFSESLTSDDMMVYYENADLMYWVTNNTFTRLERLQRQVVDSLLEHQCFDTGSDNENYIAAIRAFRANFTCYYDSGLNGNKSTATTSQRTGVPDPLDRDPIPVSFRNVFFTSGFNSPPKEVSLNLTYRLPGREGSDQVRNTIPKTFTLTERL